MRQRDPLLGAPPTIDPRQPLEVNPRGRPNRKRRRIAWGAGLQIALAIAVGAWSYGHIWWPDSLLPDGIPLGGAEPLAGVLSIGADGRPTAFSTPAELVESWRTWVHDDEWPADTGCVEIPNALPTRVPGGARPDSNWNATRHYWVEGSAGRRIGPARCGDREGLDVFRGLETVRSIRPVTCAREVFIAHGFACPAERRPALQLSETLTGLSDYYPREALWREMEGVTKVRVKRDVTGSPVSCEVLESSGSDLLDRQTCKLVGTDPLFTRPPASNAPDELGRTIVQRVVWRLPGGEAENPDEQRTPRAAE